MHERGDIVADDVPHDTARLLRYRHRPDPAGKPGWRVLAEEAGPVDPVRVAFHRQRPVPQMRQDPGRNAAMILDQLLLRDAIRREQDLLGMADLHAAVVDLQRFCLSSQRQSSRTTSSGLLSSRSPRYRGCRSLPCGVHSVKAISATSCGFTQCTPRRGGPSPANGEVAVSSCASFLPRRCKVSVSNPVPTLPAYTSFPSRW